MQGQVARKKWTGLRDYFSRIHRKMTSLKSGSVPDKRRTWYLYDQMLFLLPYVGESKTSCNQSDISDQEEEIPLEDGQIVQPVLKTTSSDVGMTTTPTKSVITGPPVQEKGRRKMAKSLQERALATTIDKEIFTAIQNISSTTSHGNPEDEDELFFKSLIPKMKTLDPVTKWELQTEIQMLVLRYIRGSRHQYPPRSGPPYEGSGSPTFACDFSRRIAHPQKGGHSSRAASPVIPHHQIGSSGNTCATHSRYGISPSPIQSYNQQPGNSDSTTPSFDYDYEQVDSHHQEQISSYHDNN